MKFKNYKEEKKYYEEVATEEEFIKWYKQQDFDKYIKPSVTVDLIGLRYFESHIQLLLIQRKRNPGKNKFALVGGFVNPNEDILEAGIRETFEETKIKIAKSQLKQLPAWTKPDRDPRGWVITNPLVVQFKENQNTDVIASDDAKNAIWFDLTELPTNMYADHGEIIKYALDTIKSRIALQGLVAIKNLLPEQFSMKDLSNIFNSLNIEHEYNNLARDFKAELKRIGNKSIGKGKPITIYKLK